MSILFSFFPAGAPGVALLILRLCAAASLTLAACCSAEWRSSAALIVTTLGVGAGIGIGLWTPALCLLAAVAHGYLHGPIDTPLQIGRLVLEITQVVALALLGPGAYSCDARRFGRRVVVLPR